MSVQPFIHDGFVMLYYVSAAFEYLVGMLESYGKDPFVKNSSADRIIRSPVEQLPPDFGITADDPSSSGTGHRIDL